MAFGRLGDISDWGVDTEHVFCERSVYDGFFSAWKGLSHSRDSYLADLPGLAHGRDWLVD